MSVELTLSLHRRDEGMALVFGLGEVAEQHGRCSEARSSTCFALESRRPRRRQVLALTDNVTPFTDLISLAQPPGLQKCETPTRFMRTTLLSVSLAMLLLG
jgi:hypothetical protein